VQAAQKPGTVENFAHGYQDYLQAPLQVRSIPALAFPPRISVQPFNFVLRLCLRARVGW